MHVLEFGVHLFSRRQGLHVVRGVGCRLGGAERLLRVASAHVVADEAGDQRHIGVGLRQDGRLGAVRFKDVFRFVDEERTLAFHVDDDVFRATFHEPDASGRGFLFGLHVSSGQDLQVLQGGRDQQGLLFDQRRQVFGADGRQEGRAV